MNTSQNSRQSAHDLMPADLAAQLPALYTTEQQGDDAIVYAHFFTPDAQWDWYVLERNPNDDLCFGLVSGFEAEMGYFDLTELRAARGPMGLAIERDLYFTPTALGIVRQRHARR